VEQDVGVQDTDATAIERVWREQGPKLWRSLLEFTGDPELASDALAEAFAQALARGEAIREPDRWVWKTSFNIAAGELQERRRRPSPSQPLHAELPEPVADLVAALRMLSPNQRAAVILCLYADLPTREAARIIGCSQTTVRVHLMQARRRLRPMLEVEDDA
jgi:RNA polymerase sigma-70 factor (ECF subfamily)